MTSSSSTKFLNVFKTVHLDHEPVFPIWGRTTCETKRGSRPTFLVCCSRPVADDKISDLMHLIDQLVGTARALVFSSRGDPILRMKCDYSVQRAYNHVLIIFTVVILVRKWRIPFGNHVWIASADSENIRKKFIATKKRPVLVQTLETEIIQRNRRRHVSVLYHRNLLERT